MSEPSKPATRDQRSSITAVDAWVLRRLRSDQPVEPDDLAFLSEPFRTLASSLADLDVDRREDVWQGFLAGRADREAMVKALAEADPDAPRPEPTEADDDLDDGWGAIRLASLPEVDPFPLDVLPEPARAFTEAVAWSIGGTRPDFTALGVLVAASAAIGGCCRVQIKPGYHQSASLFGIGNGRSSDGKSPAFRAALGPVWAIQERLRAEWKRELEIWENTPENEQGHRPVLKRIATSSPTCEALGGILRSNPRGLVVLPDEATSWLGSMNQYKSKGNDRQFWLSAWGGEPVYIDRAKDKEEPIAVPRPFLSVVGGMTPGDLAKLDSSGTAGDGFTARLLMIYPDPARRVHNHDGVHPGVEGDYVRLITRLFDRVMAEGEDGTPTARIILIDPDSRPLIEAWFDQHQAQTEEHGFPESLNAHWGKLEAYLYRIALILHLLDLASGSGDPNAEIPPISRSTIERAMRLIGYFKSHSRRVHQAMNRHASDGGDDVQALTGWIVRNEKTSFTIRDIGKNFDRFKEHRADLEDALRWMTDKNLIRFQAKPDGETRKGGRKRSPVYESNPSLWESRLFRHFRQNGSTNNSSDGNDGNAVISEVEK